MEEEIVNIDLGPLRMITGGDLALEQEMFRLFFDTAEHCLAELHAHIQDDPEGQWVECLHELKGAASNMGAHGLSGLCEEALHVPISDQSKRQQMLEFVEEEYHAVKRYILRVSY